MGYREPVAARHVLQPASSQAFDAYIPGLRVRCPSSGRLALVIGLSEFGTGRRRHVPVIVEGSTRRELWSSHAIEILAPMQQPIALGGLQQLPPGYPLIPVAPW